MRTSKRWLAVLLSVMMLISVLPLNAFAGDENSVEELPIVVEGEVNKSLLPLKEVYVNVDLVGYLKSELAAVSPKVLLANQNVSDSAEIVWRAWNDEVYTIGDMNTPIDLSAYYDRYSVTLEMIVGEADQLNKENVRYRMYITLPKDSEWFQASAETAEDPRTTIDVYDCWTSIYEDDVRSNRLYVGVDGRDWNWNQPAYVTFAFNEDVDGSDLTVKVYEGYYTDLEALTTAQAVEITEQIWGSGATGYYLDDASGDYETVTFVFTRGATGAQEVLPFEIRMSEESIWLSESDRYVEEYGYRNYIVNSRDYDDRNYDIIFELREGFAADGEYYFNLEMDDPDPNADQGECGINLVDCAFVGNYTTKEEAIAENAEDIKAQLFSEASEDGGYKADYSEGVTFTVFDTAGGVWYSSVKTIAYQVEDELPDEPDPLSSDTYFRMEGAYTADGGYLDRYVMPYDADSYYYNGYQTVFLLDDDSAVAENMVIKPTFYSGSKVNVYNSHDGASGQLQESGKSQLTFKHGEPIQYSAAAENGTHLKNYWVTFLTQQSGAKLFVNAATNSAHRDEETNLPVREVFLDDMHGNKHDVFFANVGDTALEGLTVTLTDAVNVQLDPYWTITDVTTLDAFTTTSPKQFGTNGNWANYGELPNVAKIRLIPTDTFGVISGTLTISSTNGGSETIKLTGLSGIPQIVTTDIVDGVKYVPYSSLLQTNNMYGDNLLQFEITDGELPNGVEIKPNGEIYGVPTEAGEFTFTVKAIYNNDESMSDEAEFTLVIADNTNLNVLESTDRGYDVTEFVGVEQDEAGEFILEKAQEEVFWTDGSYGYFLDFWLDGEKLVEGEDYESEEGSTKITIYAQTFKNAGKGTHTIAAEFREGDPVDGTLKRAAQNYTLNSVGKNNNTSIAPSNPTESEKPVEPGEPEVTPPTGDQDFVDVYVSDWFYGDVNWAAEQQLMVGIADRIFAPYEQISLAMVVTTLARMSEEDLAPYADLQYEDILPDEWYSDAAAWAKYNELLGTEPFTAMPPLARGRLAVVLVNYLAYKGIDTTVPFDAVTFADADQMSREELDAFKVLYHFGIFNGVGNNCMNPAGATTRAELAALLHRLSVFVERF